MEFNLLKIGFLIISLVMIVFGSVFNSFENKLPAFLKRSFRYGKFAYQETSSFIQVIEVPKRWFRHFYVFASVYSTCSLVLMSAMYFQSYRPPPIVFTFLDLLATGSRRENVGALSSLLALCLLTIHSWRRFYETWFVSVFSNSRMNLSHYMVGYIHYFGAVTSILAESPGFINGKGVHTGLMLKDFKLMNIFGSILFLWAFYHQYKAAVILANLRKNKKGSVVTFEHRIPYGDWFDVVSSPHCLAEILMYLALFFVLWGSSLWPYVFLWVISNQVETALLTHWWYKSSFQSYPTTRKAVIPYLL